MDNYLKKLYNNAEARYIWYKQELEACYKDRINFPPTDKLALWYKIYLKDCKAIEEHNMKQLKEELEYLNEGLNPPNMYKR